MYAGTPEEFDLIRQEIPSIKYLETNDFYELAQAIQGAKIFVGNSSMCFAIAEGLKVPRILESCSFAPNVIPTGVGPGYEYYSQQAFEHYVNELFTL